MGQKAKEHKLLAGMRANPRGDWNIGHIETVCASVPDVIFRPPTRGGHFKSDTPENGSNPYDSSEKAAKTVLRETVC